MQYETRLAGPGFLLDAYLVDNLFRGGIGLILDHGPLLIIQCKSLPVRERGTGVVMALFNYLGLGAL